jgi:hypothetical protein
MITNNTPETKTMPTTDRGSQGDASMWPSEFWASRIFDWANVGLIITLGAGVICTVLVVWMGGVKETYLRKELADTNAKAAGANERAAEASKAAEDEKGARLRLEKEIAPRTLDDASRIAIGNELSKFASSFSGRKVKVSSYSADAEGIVFSLEIIDVLTRAKIEVEPIVGRLIPVGLVDTGVKITGPSADEAFVKTIATSIHSHLDTAMRAEWGPQYKDVTVAVGVKPVIGLPLIKTAAK